MAIFVRASQEKNLDSFSIFKTTKDVLKWFRENLTSAMPYKKIDHVFIPDFKPVAMENVGCITYNDSFLDPTQTILESSYFHMIIAHELSHTWFGNYVTPEWWDDLWLNESFATFLAHLALKQIGDKNAEIKELKQSKGKKRNLYNIHEYQWLLFNRWKSKAVVYDQYKTTHKIRDDVEDTSHAGVIFDQITYFKGAAILKYYYYVCGNELFFKGLKNYVTKFHNKNANYNDFKNILKSLSEVRNIREPLTIIEPFLNNVGVVRLEHQLKTSLNHIDEFSIKQIPCAHASEGQHYEFICNILLIYPEENEQILNEVQISNSQVSKIQELKGLKTPLAIVLNAGDWAYFKQTFSSSTVEYLIENTFRVKDPLNRSVIARDLAEMVRDGLLEPSSYIDFSIKLLSHEEEAFIIDQVLKAAINIVNRFILYEQQTKMKETIFNLIREELYLKHMEIRKHLIKYMLDIIDCFNPDQIRYLLYFLKKDNQKLSLLRGESETLDNIHMIKKFDLSYIDEPTKFKILEAIYESDVLTFKEKTDFDRSLTKGDENLEKNKLERLTLEACLPIKEKKENLWNLFVYKDRELLDEEYEAYMKGWARKSQYKMLKYYYQTKFFDDFIYVKNFHGEKYAEIFYKHLNPGFVISEKIHKNFCRLLKDVRRTEYRLMNMINKSKFIYSPY
jgi:hypothetical protein